MKKYLAASVALVIAVVLASGAVAAHQYLITSSSQVKPGSLTGENIRNGSIKLADIAGASKEALAGQDGAPGRQGATGPKGETGATGQAGPKGATGATGAQGPKGDKGDPGAPGVRVGAWGPFSVSKTDSGCATPNGQENWANATLGRSFTVTPAQDGSGYLVTRYDLKGTYTTIAGAHDPGCDGTAFTSAGTGTFNGVWTMKVAVDAAGPVDYNPDANPSGSSWDQFLNSVFGIDSNDSHVSTVSYEFDYANTCGDHWRDSYFGAAFYGSGHIHNCP